MWHILWTIIIGLIAGIIAKFIHPGSNEPQGFILTIVLGVLLTEFPVKFELSPVCGSNATVSNATVMSVSPLASGTQ